MATKIQLLQLSPTMSEGTIVRWHVKEGDTVSAGDVLAEVETDKAVMEQEAFDDGTVLKILVPQGSSIKVGGDIALFGAPGEEAGEEETPAPQEEKKAASKEAKKPEAKEAEKNEEEEDKEKKEEPAAEKKPPEAKKAPKKAEAEAKPEEEKEKKPAAPARKEGERIFASPLARKMAEEHGIDVAAIEGSGPNGRVTKRDIEEALEKGVRKPAKAAAAGAAAAEDTEVPLGGMRKVIARRLVQSRQEVPSFNLSADINAEPLLNAVARIKERFPDEKITITHCMIKAMASMLMKHEWLRTQWVDGKLIRKAGAHISVAVAIEDGLLTPVIRDAQAKGLIEISHELKELAAKARDRKLTEEDLSGGVQTLSNLGMFEIDRFDAIINPPESSILAVGRVADKPIVVNNELKAGKVMTLTLSCDHRVVDGAVGASYLKDLKAALEEPLLMLV